MNNNAEVARKNPGVSGEVQDVLTDGFCESEESWKEVWLDLKRRGLTVDPRLAIGDGALGFWMALRDTEGKFPRSHILYQTMGLHAHPSILGPGFREPSPPHVVSALAGVTPVRGEESSA